MSVIDASVLTNHKTLLLEKINDVNAVANGRWTDNFIETMIRQGLDEMARQADSRLHSLQVKSSLNFTSQEVSIPSDCLYYRTDRPFLGNVNGVFSLFHVTEDETDVFFNDLSDVYSDMHTIYFLDGKIYASHGSMEDIEFIYIQQPTMLDATPRTEFDVDLYIALVDYVAAMLFLTEKASADQRNLASGYLMAFYTKIRATAIKELVEAQLAKLGN